MTPVGVLQYPTPRLIEAIITTIALLPEVYQPAVDILALYTGPQLLHSNLLAITEELWVTLLNLGHGLLPARPLGRLSAFLHAHNYEAAPDG